MLNPDTYHARSSTSTRIRPCKRWKQSVHLYHLLLKSFGRSITRVRRTFARYLRRRVERLLNVIAVPFTYTVGFTFTSTPLVLLGLYYLPHQRSSSSRSAVCTLATSHGRAALAKSSAVVERKRQYVSFLRHLRTSTGSSTNYRLGHGGGRGVTVGVQ